ncbi:MAG: dihydrofolate reductase family protein [Solirubrobacterales bacterium]
MGDLVVTEFVSMDGVMQAPGGEDFKYKGWTFDYDRGEDGNKFKWDEVERADAHLLGRVTYDSFAGAWPERENASDEDLAGFARMFGEAPKYVVSSTLKDPEWRNTDVIDGGGDVPGEIAKLKDQHDNILISGSRRVVQTALENDLVDEVRLMVFPTVLGTGDKVFDEYSDRTNWEIAEANPVGSDGVLTLVYRRKR